LFFHQGAVTLAHLSGLTQRVPYALQPTEPFGVPYVWSIVFWGGLWGALFAAMLTRLDGVRLVAAALLLGAVLPTLVAWFVVAPLKGQPMAANFQTTALASGVILNAAWGFGTGLGLALFGGRRVERRRTDRRITAMERRRLDRRRPIAA
jgi:predicted membrane protein